MKRFTSYEYVETVELMVKKKDGNSERFDLKFTLYDAPDDGGVGGHAPDQHCRGHCQRPLHRDAGLWQQRVPWQRAVAGDGGAH
jgi:hypothetical protein